MPSKKKNPDNPAGGFEIALKRLGQIVTELESGDLSLEQTISHYEEGVSLLRRCRRALSDVESRIKILEQSDDGLPHFRNLSHNQKIDFLDEQKSVETPSTHDTTGDKEDPALDGPLSKKSEQFLL